MFHSLFLNMFRTFQSEEQGDLPAGGAGGDGAGLATTEPSEPSTESTTPVEEGKDEPSTQEPSSEEPGDTAEPEYFYGETQVGIDIPEDISAELSSKGLDAKALVAELYSKDGGFKLSDATREKLDGAFGKFAVDAYLNSVKLTNDAFLRDEKDNQAARTQADTERFSTLTEAIGGEKGWDELAAWGQENLDEQQISDLNEVMQSGNEGLQRYAIQMLANQRRVAEGDPEAVLIQGSASREATGGALSAADYQAATSAAKSEFRRDKPGYAKAMQQLDARRRAGINKGL